eukprot:SAG11_NODE_24_length_24699_cov_10.132195_6_plen_134_part_00
MSGEELRRCVEYIEIATRAQLAKALTKVLQSQNDPRRYRHFIEQEPEPELELELELEPALEIPRSGGHGSPAVGHGGLSTDPDTAALHRRATAVCCNEKLLPLCSEWAAASVGWIGTLTAAVSHSGNGPTGRW